MNKLVYEGFGMSLGKASGRAVVLTNPKQASQWRIEKGDILVCHSTNALWTPLFKEAAGVVTGIGSLLCHAAIVAREYKIPALTLRFGEKEWETFFFSLMAIKGLATTCSIVVPKLTKGTVEFSWPR